jgi:hypothetical protein
MRNDQDSWDLAKLLIEQHGPDAQDRAQATEQLLSYIPESRDRTSIVEAVRVMEALLSVDGHTIH